MTRTRLSTTVVAGVLIALSIGLVRASVTTSTAADTLARPAEVPQRAQFIGMGNCATSKCHVDEATWATRLDGDGTGKRSHLNAANQLAKSKYPNVDKYVKATNAGSAYSVTCTKCHATTLPGDDFEGVTCERCHGAGSLYKDKHADEKKPASAYESLGMKDYSKGSRWAGLCYSCHVLGPEYLSLVTAGHPNGSDFDLSKKFHIVQGVGGKRTHWKKPERTPTAAQVAAFAGPRPAMASARAIPAPTPSPEAPAAPVPTPVTPTVSATGSTPSAPLTSAAPPTPSVSRDTFVPPPPMSAPTRLPAATTTSAPIVRATPPAPAPTASSEPSPAPIAEGPRTVSAVLASVQGRVISVLASLLGQDVSVPQRVVPAKQPPDFSGPDAELLRLQYDVITLALELLGSAPPKGGR